MIQVKKTSALGFIPSPTPFFSHSATNFFRGDLRFLLKFKKIVLCLDFQQLACFTSSSDTFFTLPTLFYHRLFSPWEKRSEAFTLGVHLILLYFISILLSPRRLLFYFDVDVDVDVGVDVGGGLFLSLNLLKIIWYIV